MTAEILAYLRERGDEASISEITAAIQEKYPDPPSSSIRSLLQNERYFVRVRRGVFKAAE